MFLLEYYYFSKKRNIGYLVHFSPSFSYFVRDLKYFLIDWLPQEIGKIKFKLPSEIMRFFLHNPTYKRYYITPFLILPYGIFTKEDFRTLYEHLVLHLALLEGKFHYILRFFHCREGLITLCYSKIVFPFSRRYFTLFMKMEGCGIKIFMRPAREREKNYYRIRRDKWMKNISGLYYRVMPIWEREKIIQEFSEIMQELDKSSMYRYLLESVSKKTKRQIEKRKKSIMDERLNEIIFSSWREKEVESMKNKMKEEMVIEYKERIEKLEEMVRKIKKRFEE